MAKPKATKSETVRIRLEPNHRELFERAGAALGLDLSNFLRLSAMEKIDLLRKDGKKI